jgi:hypothetical protein
MDLPEIATDNQSSETSRFNNWIALAVALLSAFMAVSKVKDDNIVQAMQKAQAESVDLWNEYQARRQRQFGVELAIAQLKATQPDSEDRAKTVTDWQKTADTFKARAEEASVKAKQRVDDYNAGNDRDDLFDLSDALLSVAIALFAITALLRKRWLFGVAGVLGTAGITFAIAGFNAWTWMHPDFIINLLN